VASSVSSLRRCLKYVRMQTVIGGKVAPAAAAKIRIRTGWERASIDKTTESGRDGGGEPGDPDRQPADHGRGNSLLQVARLEQRGIAGEGDHEASGVRLSHPSSCCIATRHPTFHVEPTATWPALVPRETLA